MSIPANPRQCLSCWLIAVAAFLGGSPSGSAETLFRDDFLEAGDINARTPGVSFNGASWKAGTGAAVLISDGNTMVIDPAIAQLAVLEVGENYFNDNPGIYVLSCDVTFSQADGAEDRWVALGFNNGYNPSSSFNAMNESTGGAAPWMLLRARGSGHVYEGRGAAGFLANIPESFPPGQRHTLKLILDTRNEQWTLEAFVDDLQISFGRQNELTHTFAAKPEIRYVGISANPAGTVDAPSATNVTIDNFRLEKISETETK